MKTKIFSVFLIVVFASIVLYASSTGITGLTRKTSNEGCSCHGATPNAAVNVSITGPDTLAPNQSAVYTATVTGGPLAGAGIDISASTGALSVIAGQGLKLLIGELTHTSPKTAASGSVTFQFNYQAPATAGSTTLFATGNSVNLNGNNSGDGWNFAPNKTIVVANPATGVNDKQIASVYQLNQNYPNPFNPATKISFKLNKGSELRLAIYNELGKEVAVLVNGYRNEGDYSVDFNAEGLSSGVYYYKLTTDAYSETKKMLLLK